MNEFIRPVSIRIHKANDAGDRDRCVRIYKDSLETWQFQLRSPLGIGSFGLRDGKDFCIAGASCSIDDIRAIRDALGAILDEAETERGCCGENETGSGEHSEECPEAPSQVGPVHGEET